VNPVDPNEVHLERLGGLVEAEVDGELVALHIENGKCYGFNGTATRIWSLLGEPKSLAQLCRDIVDEYEVSREGFEEEIFVFIQELQADGLVKVSIGAPAISTEQ
jgi:hypothetical protein